MAAAVADARVVGSGPENVGRRARGARTEGPHVVLGKPVCRVRGAQVKFEKWQALGNDYMIVERGDLPFELTPARIRRICAPHTGVGSDGILLLVASRASAASSPSCGSSTPTGPRPSCRATARARRSCTCAAAAGPTATRSRSRPPPARSGRRSRARTPARSTWAAPSCARKDFPSGGPTTARGTLTATAASSRFQHVSVGNPQCAIEVGDELEELDLPRSARRSSNTSSSRTARTCRSGAATADDEITARIFERGVGETMSSGTGAKRRGRRRRAARRRQPGDRPPRRRRPRGRGGGGPAREPDRLGACPSTAASSADEFVKELNEDRVAPGADPAVPVRRARAEDRREEGSRAST